MKTIDGAEIIEPTDAQLKELMAAVSRRIFEKKVCREARFRENLRNAIMASAQEFTASK
ncbi:MAG: hypothetical protein IJY80_03580 [Opitutales bacterium]|nr:hypothetical protein [Opitutales bacterium]MBQ9758836.1 hypothetical protein [Opitutales bacterium]